MTTSYATSSATSSSQQATIIIINDNNITRFVKHIPSDYYYDDISSSNGWYNSIDIINIIIVQTKTTIEQLQQ
jgi:hypothetical protein